MKQLKLNVSAREGKGRSASRRLRSGGKIPAILYGKRTAPVQLAIDAPEFRRLLKTIGGSASLIELDRPDGQPALSFLQEVQKDPLTDEYLHVDLHEVATDEKMEIYVTVRVLGESFGVKNENGILEVTTHHLRIRCLPKDLPEFIEIDVSDLHLNQSVHVNELKKLPGVEFLDNPIQPVVACVEPPAEEEVAVAAEAVAVEGEVPAEGVVPEGGAAAPAAAGAAPAAGAAAAPGAKGAPAAPGAKGAVPAAGAKAATGAAPVPGAKGAAPAAGAKAAAPAAPAEKKGGPRR